VISSPGGPGRATLRGVIRLALVGTGLVALAGCARATLPYTPAQQPAGATLSAAYLVVGDRLRIEIDTDGRRLEEAVILRPDGTAVQPQAIEPAPASPTGYPAGVGIGIGGGSFGGGVGVGTGVSVGFPIGSGSGGRLEGTTLAWFPLAQAGSAPWRIHVKVAGAGPAVIVVGGPAPGQ
jgi:hypothetical protein